MTAPWGSRIARNLLNAGYLAVAHGDGDRDTAALAEVAMRRMGAGSESRKLAS